MLNNIKTETKMSRLLFYYTSIKITYFYYICCNQVGFI